MKWIGPTIGACVCAAAMSAGAGALDECMIRGDRATVTRCLADADAEAQTALVKAEGTVAKLARDLDTATGRPGAAAAFARSMRAFADYRKAQCDFVKAMYASGSGAEQAMHGCMIDMTRRRVRDVQN